MRRYQGQTVQAGVAIGVIHRLASNAQESQEPFILAADELTPELFCHLQRELLQGIVVTRCGMASHVAMLAREADVPMLCGVDVGAAWNGMPAVLDADTSELLVKPTKEALLAARAKQSALENERCRLKARLGVQAPATARTRVFATLSDISGARAALRGGAEGVGLFRSETLFWQSDTPPDEDLQYWAYRALLNQFHGAPVTVRTLDLGADKRTSALRMPAEPNPALGCRGIRLWIARPELHVPQLRALLRAAVHGSLRVLYPFVNAPEELIACKQAMAACATALTREGIPHGIPQQGVMIETPAAVMLAPELAQEADFFSVGTSDLAQYVLAADRQSNEFYCARHPAVLRMLHMAVQAALARGIPLCACGTLAEDIEMTKALCDLGIHDFSVSPGRVLALRTRLAGMGAFQSDASQP
ncbi:MAG: putative PEP-binding protein [Clostridia bacterium]